MNTFIALVFVGILLDLNICSGSEVAGEVSLTTAKTSEEKPVHHYPLPPVAMPGILKDFEPALKPRRQKRFLTELRFLKNGMSPADKPLTRKRRSLASPTLLSRTFKLIGARKRRDLRRLRRDLSYSLAPEEGFLQQQQQEQQERSLQTPPNNKVLGEELGRLLRRLKLYDQLPLHQKKRTHSVGLKQAESLGPPSTRFAPQPKLFRDEAPYRGPPTMRVRPNSEWEDYIYSDGYSRLPEKRFPKPGAWGGLAMVPGLKRSVFREAAAAKQQELRKAHGIVKRGRRESDPSMANFLGTSVVKTNSNRIPRTAM